MNQEKFEKWLRDHPLLVNAVFPCVGIATMMLIMFTCMQIIDWVI